MCPAKLPIGPAGGLPGSPLTAVVVPAVSPLTVVTAETASKQLRAVKTHWNVRQSGQARLPLQLSFCVR